MNCRNICYEFPHFSISKLSFRLHLSKGVATRARDSLVKAIYKHIFQFVIDTFNRDVDVDVSLPYIGLIDITGFGKNVE